MEHLKPSIKLFLIIVLFGISLWAWGNFFTKFNRDKGEIIPQVADIADNFALPYRLFKLSREEPDTELLVPVQGIRLRNIADSWGDPRPDNRTHEGIDIFAPRGTPVFSATRGYVVRTGVDDLGGNIVFVMGAGGVRYYYAHLDRIAEGIDMGEEVTTDTVLGFVGNTGNAITTPPHLHFGVYDDGAENPYPLLTDR